MPRKKVKRVTKKGTTKTRKTRIRHKFITIVLLYDQYTRRMKAYGPTSLIPIKNSKLLDYHIKYINDIFPKNEIVICTGFNSEKVEKYVRQHYNKQNIRIVENQIFEETNSCESLRLCLNNITNNNILIVNGGIFFYKDALSKIDLKTSCVLVEKNNLTLDIGINENKNLLEHMDVGLASKWTEIIFINNKSAVDHLRKVVSESTFKKKFIFEAINRLVQAKNKISCIENKKHSVKLDNAKAYNTVG